MKELLQKIAEISERYEHLSQVSGNDFNVFNVINVTTNEVRLHSKFIAELLNPKGSHGQEDIFLKLFTEKFKIDIDTTSARVKIEKYLGVKTETTGGYLDIYIYDNKGRSIIIENKIYAPDQENQLLRYYNFSPNNIFYLTLFGDEPSAHSCGGLKVEDDFKIISYHEDIKEWLIACRKEAVELPLLREGISHYLNLIETLTGQSSNDIMNTEIKDYISSNAETLKQAALVEENMTDAKIKIQWLFWQSLKDKMIANGLELVEKDNVTWQNVKKFYDARNRDQYFGFWVKVFEKDDVSVHFGIEVENEVYFGFTLERNKKGNISNLEENTKYRNLVSDLNGDYRNNVAWLGWRYLKQRLDFRAFNSEAIFELADRKKLDKKTDAIVEDILQDINILKNKLENI